MAVEPITILILGPMEKKGEDAAGPMTATKALVALVKEIATALKAEFLTPGGVGARPGDIFVEGPDDNTSNLIIPGVLEKIERADLVIFDLTGQKPNVAYEVGLVHALGLPYILLTGDNDTIFYFKTGFCIRRFDIAAQTKEARDGRAMLRERIAAFVRAANSADGSATVEEFRRNHVSAFFDDVAIVDISGPAGIAAGYWMNSVERFVKPGGYIDGDAPRRIGGKPRDPQDPGLGAFRIRAYIAVHPPSDLMDLHEADNRLLSAAIAAAGFKPFEGSIYDQPGDAPDIRKSRPFFGQYLAAPPPAGAADADVRDAVVLEIPTTLYALRHSWRIKRIQDHRAASEARRDALCRRRYRDMLARFDKLMQHYCRPAGLSRARAFRFVDVRDPADPGGGRTDLTALRATLAEFGIAPAR